VLRVGALLPSSVTLGTSRWQVQWVHPTIQRLHVTSLQSVPAAWCKWNFRIASHAWQCRAAPHLPGMQPGMPPNPWCTCVAVVRSSGKSHMHAHEGNHTR
jgi:hypothetical protein